MLKKLFIILIAFATTLSVNAQQKKDIKKPHKRPKLIVGIVVEQLRFDDVFRYSNKFGNNGFLRLMGEGSFCRNVRLNYQYTQSEPGFATLVTGAQPAVNGIISKEWYEQLLGKKVSCVADAQRKPVGGSFDMGLYSPKQLMSSTSGDELRLSSNKQSKVISVATNPAAAVLTGGQTANAAYWFDPITGSFMTNSYYMETLPSWVSEFNRKNLSDIYMTRKWETIKPINEYVESLPDDSKYETGIYGQHVFPYDLTLLREKASNKKPYNLLLSTPFSNELIKDFAISTIVNENLGKDEHSDMLWVTFSATQEISSLFGANSIEMQDAVLRLDENIQHFLDFIDSFVGKQNTLIVLTSVHGSTYSPEYLTDNGLAAGAFSLNQAVMLLNSYLNARYGKADWIKQYSDLQIYLNREYIQQSKLDLEKLQTEAAQFLLQFSGVANVLTSTLMEKNYYSSGFFYKMQNSYNQKRSGDLLINLAPGWVEKSDGVVKANSAYNYDSHVPLFFYGWRIPNQAIYRQLDITDVAATLSSILEVPLPNASQGQIIDELIWPE